MGENKLQKWAKELPLKDRLEVQKFMIKLYSMEIDDGKN